MRYVAGPPGFEPRLTDPESVGLPLPHGPPCSGRLDPRAKDTNSLVWTWDFGYDSVVGVRPDAMRSLRSVTCDAGGTSIEMSSPMSENVSVIENDVPG